MGSSIFVAKKAADKGSALAWWYLDQPNLN
jgi:hypothetical protein